MHILCAMTTPQNMGVICEIMIRLKIESVNIKISFQYNFYIPQCHKLSECLQSDDSRDCQYGDQVALLTVARISQVDYGKKTERRRGLEDDVVGTEDSEDVEREARIYELFQAVGDEI